MSVDKSIDYVEQDGSLNFIKNSESVTVPKKFKARKNAPKVKLAYITDAEAKMLKKKKPGTPHKGPKGIPSYDTFGSIDRDTGRDTGVSGETASGFERGDSGERSRADARAAGFSPQDVQDFRSAAIAAGAGQRVNPGFFDSRDTVSPAELRAAKAINPTAFKAGRRGGIMDFITSGGFLGNLVRGLGQRLGLGKRFNEPTYDMSQFNNLGLLTGRVNPSYYNDLDNKGLLSLINDTNLKDTNLNDIDLNDIDLNDIDLGNPLGDSRIVPEEQGLEGDGSFKISSSPLSNLTPDQLQQRVDIANQFDLPLDYSASDLDARARRAMTQPGLNIQLEPNDPNVPDEIEFLDGQKFVATPYDPYR